MHQSWVVLDDHGSPSHSRASTASPARALGEGGERPGEIGEGGERPGEFGEATREGLAQGREGGEIRGDLQGRGDDLAAGAYFGEIAKTRDPGGYLVGVGGSRDLEGFLTGSEGARDAKEHFAGSGGTGGRGDDRAGTGGGLAGTRGNFVGSGGTSGRGHDLAGTRMRRDDLAGSRDLAGTKEVAGTADLRLGTTMDLILADEFVARLGGTREGMDRDVRVALELAERSFLLANPEDDQDDGRSLSSSGTIALRGNHEFVMDSEHYAFQELVTRSDTPMSFSPPVRDDGGLVMATPSPLPPLPPLDHLPSNDRYPSLAKTYTPKNEQESFWEWAVSFLPPPGVAFSHILIALVAVYVDRRFCRQYAFPTALSSSHGSGSSSNGGIAAPSHSSVVGGPM